MRKIPKTMSTQHPDNVNSPFFSSTQELGGEDEIHEAFYAFSHLGCSEQMWDSEGKEVDNFVVKKLLTKHGSFFKKHVLGEDIFITLRVPNPTIEKTEAKLLLETLESIPRSFDAAKLFYQADKAPIFEVILPMTTSAKCLNRIYNYYKDFVVGKQNQLFADGDITIGEWIGEFKPASINIIPLFEDKDNMLDSHNIVREFLQDKNIDEVGYQRVFFARSDPAMNYGMIGSVLLNKIALKNLDVLSKDLNIKIYPIIGVGSAPFRGNLRPQTVDRVLEEYPSVHTFSIQSSFKYDNFPEDVRKAIEKIEQSTTKQAQQIDEDRSLKLIDRYAKEYGQQAIDLAPVVNKVAKYIPGRRKRKLHTGLFGYSRNIGGVSLPRVITFTAALYSLGLPPELLGLNALTEEDISFVKTAYIHFEEDMRDALLYYNPDCPFVPQVLKDKIEKFFPGYKQDEEHRKLAAYVAKVVSKGENIDLSEYVLRAANIRGFLG
jgi:phosphoenolpyruvate carboxylase